MLIERASEMGFCFGVRRAINMLKRAAAKHDRVETLGPIVHNEQVVKRLAADGVRAVSSLDELEGGVVAITSHGVSPAVLEEIKSRGLQAIDTTCPFVRKAQTTARKLADAGFFVLIFGEADHSEVQGVLGWAGGRGIAALDEASIELSRLPRRVGILSQTTQSPSRFAHFVKRFIDLGLGKIEELRVIDTICDATRKRQGAALDLAKRVNLMIVVGGRDSANTRRLAEVCSTAVETHHIEETSEIEASWLEGRDRIGVTAGASTPDEIAEEVIQRLEEMTQAKASPASAKLILKKGVKL